MSLWKFIFLIDSTLPQISQARFPCRCHMPLKLGLIDICISELVASKFLCADTHLRKDEIRDKDFPVKRQPGWVQSSAPWR